MRSIPFASVLSILSILGYSRAVIDGKTRTTQASPRCKAVPGTQGWPSDADWANLKRAVGGRLLRPLPPAAACHRGMSGYSPGACETLKESWKNGDWHLDHPTSNFWQNYNNYSCMPDSASPCTTKGFPIYVVDANLYGDVKAAVDFARTRNIRLNIKSTGHDFLGRSVQPNSLSIWTHHLKGMKWFNTGFAPKGCNFTINGPAVTVGAGMTWSAIYEEADARNIGVVGGAFSSVSVGGFLANGGHGKMSAKYGLGADMVLEIELVTAAGEMIAANECQNEEFFWAMRGGGGSTYGVVLSYTIQGIRTGTAAKYKGTFHGWNALTYLHTQWAKIARVGGSGYIKGYPFSEADMTFSITLPNATSAQLKAIVDPIVRNLQRRSISPSKGNETMDGNEEWPSNEKTKFVGEYKEYNTWAELRKDESIPDVEAVERAAAGTFPGLGGNKIITSWLWSEKDVNSPRLRQALRGSVDTETQYLNDATLGYGSQHPPFIRGGGNAVNPAFRTAIMRPAAELQWEGSDPRKLAKKKQDAQKFLASLKSLNPTGGAYANEADPDTPDWQHAFWGSNYEHLLQIKRTVDPLGVFYCRACVGSEFYDDTNGILCRKEE